MIPPPIPLDGRRTGPPLTRSQTSITSFTNFTPYNRKVNILDIRINFQKDKDKGEKKIRVSDLLRNNDGPLKPIPAGLDPSKKRKAVQQLNKEWIDDSKDAHEEIAIICRRRNTSFNRHRILESSDKQ